ncbi:MAG: hypothetical protein SVV67_10430 [Bacillota bacterium]|nr:hypothetical protein [Bacillota bacterium]
MDYRPALKKDLIPLNQILYNSEAYWNHDEHYMASFVSLYQLTEKDLATGIVRIMEKDSKIIGFFRIESEGNSGRKFPK